MDKQTRAGRILARAQQRAQPQPRCLKAKEWAAWFADRLKAGTPEPRAAFAVARGMLEEVQILAKMRRAETDDEMVTIIREQSVKWRAFTRCCAAPIQRNGLGKVIQACMTELWNTLDDDTKKQLLWE